MKVTDLFIYPIKSCRGIEVEEAEVTPKGFKSDRQFMLTDNQGKFLTQRKHPNLAKIQVKISDEMISLTTDNRETFSFKPLLTGREIEVEIWRDHTRGIDQGEEVAEWFKAALELKPEEKCHLVKQSPKYIRPIDPKYAETENQPVSFADGYPFLLTTEASLQELNRRLSENYPEQNQTVPMNRFRPNIVINTKEPFIEGEWKLIQIGEVKFTLVKPCSRCIVTTTNQLTGARNEQGEPLKTLSKFRQIGNQGIMFGENMIPQNTGIVRIGDQIKILK
ncbi:MAG: MOSC N-terminal beta barrel domain-containing protein [Gomphosphaeria aponina SAG 52.96 = DSM 107014]|uniref:MOSC N-terminal beta barrel domain-containing protein n=1 Tax=Gomphosphaeria aponina SAG 52.96 = DSM 107014 TaxID=1521640 RepID=A0A941JQN8_9CHRO|nr:MOSC N-terminal beta barrel domain-containing protein [Gomphosphaeria aponina SAG 52.96 = DSM 107014]